MDYSIEEKIEVIENSASFAEVPHDVMPMSYKEDYYFVSYSHKDYKEVLKDILRLEEMGINIWYDSDMHIGENWQEIAEQHISKFQCLGIIFYLTENSICSPACNKEVAYVLDNNKHFITINKKLDGCQSQSGYAMLCELVKRGFECSSELMSNFEKAFPDEVLYIPIDTDIATKAQQIISLPRESVFDFSYEYPHNFADKQIAVNFCHDNTLISVDLSKKQVVDDNNDYIKQIGDCVFTNSIKLKQVSVSPYLSEIGESAFRNCVALETIDLSKTDGIYIKARAFQNCQKLHSVDLSKASFVGSNAFAGCKELCVDKVNGQIGEHAFNNTATKEVELLDNICLEKFAFADCDNLEKVVITHPFTQDLSANAFLRCKKLAEISPFVVDTINLSSYGKDYLEVGEGCFQDDVSLKNICFEGPWHFDSSAWVFGGCISLEKIDLDITGTVLPISFARNCENLVSITNSERFAVVGEKAFSGCKKLSSFSLDNAVKVGREAFAGTDLRKAFLQSAEEIQSGAFSSCNNLNSVTIGENCSVIGDCAFSKCPSLFSVKLLFTNCPFKSFTNAQNVFYGSSIKVLYVRSKETYLYLLADGVLDGLKYLYIGDNVDTSGLDLTKYQQVESDENGFVKLENPSVDLPLDINDEDVDITDSELNLPIATRQNWQDGNGLKRYPQETYCGVPRYLGEECLIRHARLQEKHTYFVEEVVATDDGAVEQFVVSVHSGKSFVLPGSVIEEIGLEFDAKQSGIKIEGTTKLDTSQLFVVKNSIATELDGKTCRIDLTDGKTFVLCSIMTAMVLQTEPPMSSPYVDENGLYYLKSIIYQDADDGHIKAISVREIGKIYVFDDNFEVAKVISNTLID